MRPASAERSPAARRRGPLIGAALALEFDYARMAAEIDACEEFFIDTPPYQRQVDGVASGLIPFRSESAANYARIDTMVERDVRRRELRGVRIFYLRNSTENDVVERSSFAVTKALPHASWSWRPELASRIPYTIECIESLPYRTLGLIRVFVCDDTFMPTHRDTDPDANPDYDRSKAVGLSLIPRTGDVGMLIWDRTRRRARELSGNALLFDDSNWHGVPMTRGRRITIRIFGEIDPTIFEDRLVDACHA
ncbi:MAG: hypothetical protein QOD26_2624 [Betaproteobacteria bacterium]|jgi:hypothetical protein|nr:hypothetical protein [Betaproteobacteria bacterium]